MAPPLRMSAGIVPPDVLYLWSVPHAPSWETVPTRMIRCATDPFGAAFEFAGHRIITAWAERFVSSAREAPWEHFGRHHEQARHICVFTRLAGEHVAA